jgi:ABC-type nitrate/sulfonate/bicarbonate transport system permease component
MTPMIIVSALIAFFPVVVNTVLGLRSVDPELIDLMRTLNASERQILWKIRLPFALPYVLSSFRIAAPGAVIGALVGEFVGGVRGLGFVLVTAHGRLDTAAVFLMVTLSVFLGLLFFVVVIAIEKRVLRWHPSTLETA